MQLAGLIRGWFQLVYAACKWLQLTDRSSLTSQLIRSSILLTCAPKCVNWEVEIGRGKLRCANLTKLDVIRLILMIDILISMWYYIYIRKN